METGPIREHLYQGKPVAEHPSEVADALTEQRNAFLREHAVDFPEGAEFINRHIDFAIVKELIAEEYAKMGLGSEHIPDVPLYFFEPGKMGLNERGNFRRAAYASGHDLILISRPWIEGIMTETAKDGGTLGAGELRLLLAPIFHEKMHSVSGTVVDQYPDKEIVQSGLSTQMTSVEGKRVRSKFVLIDEALTELWSEQLVARYLQRTGFSKEAEYMAGEVDQIARGREPHTSWVYKPEIRFLLTFVENSAAALKVAPELILNALKRAKVHNKTADFEVFLHELAQDSEIVAQFDSDMVAKIEHDLLT